MTEHRHPREIAKEIREKVVEKRDLWGVLEPFGELLCSNGIPLLMRSKSGALSVESATRFADDKPRAIVPVLVTYEWTDPE